MGARGLRNASHDRHEPLVPLTRVPALILRHRGPHREIDFLRLWLPKTFVVDTWLVAVNENMPIKRNSGSKDTRKLRHKVDEKTFWKWLCRYLREHLRATPGSRDAVAKLHSIRFRGMGDGRFKKINGVLAFSEATLVKLFDVFNDLAPQLVQCGSAITIDETILSYYGRDARAVKIWRVMREKPHQKGLIQWRSIAEFRLSSRRVILNIVPFLPTQRYTPTQAAVKMIAKLRNRGVRALHVFLDAGFSTEELISYMAANEVAYTLCVKQTYTGTLAPLRDYAAYHLAAGQARTFEYEGHLVQGLSSHDEDADTEDTTTVVISNGYATRASDNVRYHRRGTYSAAVNDYLNESDINKLRAKYPGHEGESAQAIILAATGYDVLMPPPDNDCGPQSWTREGLNKMKVKQLLDVAKHLMPTRALPTNKDGLIEYIIEHHPNLERNVTRQRMAQARPADLHNLYDQLGLDATDHKDVIANFNRFKGLVDTANKDLYQYFRLSGHKCDERLTAASVLHALLLNAWSSHDEHVLTEARRQRPAITAEQLNGLRVPFPTFVATAMQQVIAEINA